MKKLIGILTLVMVFSLTANAQRQGQKGQRNDNRPSLNSEQVAELQTKKLDLLLELNDSQKDKIHTIFKKQAEERELARTEMRERRTTGKRPTEEERFAFQSKRLDRQIANKAEMKKILNKDQFEKWEKNQALRMQQAKKNSRANKSGTKGRNNTSGKRNSQQNDRRN